MNNNTEQYKPKAPIVSISDLRKLPPKETMNVEFIRIRTRNQWHANITGVMCNRFRRDGLMRKNLQSKVFVVDIDRTKNSDTKFTYIWNDVAKFSNICNHDICHECNKNFHRMLSDS